MTDYLSDETLDSTLRNIEVPAGLAQRLRALGTWPEEEVERSLTEVPVPSSLVGRLHSIPFDAEIGADLQNVPPATSLPESLYSIAHSIRLAPHSLPAAWNSPSFRALAALLILAVTISYIAFSSQLLLSVRHSSHDSELVEANAPVVTTPAVELEFPAVVAPTPPPQNSLATHEPVPDKIPYTNLEELAPLEKISPAFEKLIDTSNRQQLISALNNFGEYILGAPPPTASDAPDLETVHLPGPRGILTPFLKGFDRGFLLKTGVHPPIAPPQESPLWRSVAPLSLKTDSFDSALHAAQTGQKISPNSIRTEDFLAAMRSGLESPTNTNPRISLANVPSLFGPPGSSWLGIHVSGGQTKQATRSSTHLIVAVELSPRMIESGNWHWLRTGLLEGLARQRSADRLSIVVVQRHVLLRSEPLNSAAGIWLEQALPKTSDFSEPDTGLALRTALEVALTSNTGCQATQVLLVSEGLGSISVQFDRHLREIGEKIKPVGVGITYADVGREREITPVAQAITKALQGDARKIVARRPFVQLMQQCQYGDNAVSAADTQLLVRFMPNTVRAYRLAGHEANAMAQLIPPASQIALHPGDETCVLFEILPRENLKATVLAECELTWNEPHTGQLRTLKKSLTRPQLLTSWEEGAYWLRQAVLAAETADWYRGVRLELRPFGWNSENCTPTRLLGLVKEIRGYNGESNTLAPLMSILTHAASGKGK